MKQDYVRHLFLHGPIRTLETRLARWRAGTARTGRTRASDSERPTTCTAADDHEERVSRPLKLVGHNSIGSQRGIAWRCSDSLSLREFLGVDATQRTPDHSSLTVIRKRLPIEVFYDVFTFVLKLAEKEGFFRGKIAGIDATLLEANAAMKSIVRDKPEEQEKAYRANRRRVNGARNRKLQRLRSEYTERSFAHTCETGDARRS